MNLHQILKLLTVLQVISLSQNSHVQDLKRRMRGEFRGVIGRQNHNKYQEGRGSHRLIRTHINRNRWTGRRKSVERFHHYFTAWSAWSECGKDCIMRKERYCKVRRKCGYTKHLEERKCWECHSGMVWNSMEKSSAVIINSNTNGVSQTPKTSQPNTPLLDENHVSVPVLHEIIEDDDDDQSDFFVINSRPKYKHKLKHILIDFEEYEDLKDEKYDEEILQDVTDYHSHHYIRPVHSIRARSKYKKTLRTRQRSPLAGRRNLPTELDFGETFEYDDFDVDQGQEMDRDGLYSELYKEHDFGEYNNSSSRSPVPSKEKAAVDNLTPRHRRIYSKWSRWTKCSPKCTTRRYKKCRVKDQCGREVLREIAYCYTEGSFCQQWLQAQVQKSAPYELRPVAASRRHDASDGTSSNSIVSDYIMSGKGYRGPEYSPMKLKCGIAAIRNNKRNMYNMLKIIGGKASKKGEWPWQVAIFNRFKEAFCGGTLIAPLWILTAAHCVRKVLYVRLGEHNLDYEDGTEIQLRVLKSIKHPNFDKKTVDSDIALLRLPNPVNATTWMGFSCLPQPYQPLPRNMECTVIGWGKRRNRDQSGTSVLHQAEVPIIPMDNCRSVYHDYTITKNMFCAGHKRGRIDTCAGDSGGPLLCRDTTKPNHPWTIFGITSFGDGCAKRNKFGIYAKVPNYVDWIWSVINCNGNCKNQQLQMQHR